VVDRFGLEVMPLALTMVAPVALASIHKEREGQLPSFDVNIPAGFRLRGLDPDCEPSDADTLPPVRVPQKMQQGTRATQPAGKMLSNFV
jgi:hypothetical protein